MRLIARRSRAQVLPMWSMGIIATFALMFLAMNYANAIRYQIRAQNAADSAAQALVSVQSQQFNLQIADLYALNVEEYRFRRLLDGMLLAIDQSGGCIQQTQAAQFGYATEGYCNRVYIDQRAAMIRSANRFSTDAQLLQNASKYVDLITYAFQDSPAIMTAFTSNCNRAVRTVSQANVNLVAPNGGDCAFKYNLIGLQTRTGLGNVEEDAQGITVPSFGSGAAAGTDGENNRYYAPIQVDVVTCAAVPPIIPFFPVHLGPYYAIGRAAATNVQIEQDWLQPGEVDDYQRRDPLNDQVFQPNEQYTTPSNQSPSIGTGSFDWFNVNYGGTAGVAYTNYNLFSTPITADELDVRLGWWAPIPIKPFATNQVSSTSC